MKITKNLVAVIGIFIASIVIGVIALLYIKGYSIGSDEIVGGTPIVKGGNLIIDSDPNGTTIYINGEQKGKTKDKFNNLSAGEYKIDLKRDQYNPWSKEIKVEEGFVTEIFANLFPITPKVETIRTVFDIDKILAYYNSNERMLILAKDGSLWIANLQQGLLKKENSFINLLDTKETSKLPPNSIYSISPDSKQLLIYKKGNPNIFIISANTTNNNMSDLTVKLELDPTNIYWGDDSKTLLIENSNLLFSYGLESKRYILLLNKADKKVNFTTEKGLVYLEDNSLYIYDNFSSLKKEIKLSNYIPENKESPAINYIFASPDLKSILLASDTTLYYLNEDEKQLEKISSKFSSFKNFSNNSNTILYCSTNEDLMSFILDTSRLHGVTRSNKIGMCSEYTEWSIDSRNIISYASLSIKESTRNQLVVEDYDGLNKYIINKNILLNNQFILTKDKRIIYAKKILSKEKDDSPLTVKLVEINLKKSQPKEEKEEVDFDTSQQ